MSFSSARKISLDNVPSVNNVEILADILGKEDSLFKLGRAHRKRMREGKLHQTSFAQPTSTSSFHSPRGSKIFSPRGSEAFTFQTLQSPRLSKDFSRPIPLNTEAAATQSSFRVGTSGNESKRASISKSQIWDWRAESDFQYHKEQAQALFSKEVKSSSWNEVSLAPFIQASQREETQKSHRNHLFDKYRRGEILTADEYASIAHTSQLLNLHSDQHFIQNVVDQLDPEVIDAVRINTFI